MADQLQHDPNTKQKIKDALYLHLYATVEKQFKQRLDQIIVRNAAVCGYSHQSFMYKNVLYNCDATAVPRKMNRLTPALQPAMNDLLKEMKQINDKEVPYVIGYINQVLN
jgi:HD superfamily phosphohydrolase YqeK